MGWKDGRKFYCRAMALRGENGNSLIVSETPDRIGIKLSVVNKGKEMSVTLDKDRWEALNDCRYELEVKTKAEAVVDKLADGEEVNEVDQQEASDDGSEDPK